MGDSLFFVIPTSQALEKVSQDLEVAIRRVVSPITVNEFSLDLVDQDCKHFTESTSSFNGSQKMKFDDVTLLADYGSMAFNPYKITSLYDSVYSVKRDQTMVAVTYRLSGVHLIKRREKNWNGYIMDIATTNSGLFAILLQARIMCKNNPKKMWIIIKKQDILAVILRAIRF